MTQRVIGSSSEAEDEDEAEEDDDKGYIGPQ